MENKYFYKDVKGYKDENGDYDILKNQPFTRFKSKTFGININFQGHIENITGFQIRERLKWHEKSHRQIFSGWSNVKLENDFN